MGIYDFGNQSNALGDYWSGANLSSAQMNQLLPLFAYSQVAQQQQNPVGSAMNATIGGLTSQIRNMLAPGGTLASSPPSGLDANQGGTVDRTGERSLSSLFDTSANQTNQTIGNLSGTLLGLLTGIPGLGLLGAGIGTGIDLSNANDRLGLASGLLGSTATGPLGVDQLGFRDFLGGLFNGLTFGIAGRSIGDAERDALSGGVQNANPEQRDAINRNDPAYWENQIANELFGRGAPGYAPGEAPGYGADPGGAGFGGGLGSGQDAGGGAETGYGGAADAGGGWGWG